MKQRKIKILTIILAIVLVSLVSFVGVYTQVQNRMENQLKDFTYTMDINGQRQVELLVSEETNEVIKDSEGNEVTDADQLTDEQLAEKGYKKEEVKDNSDEVLTTENYKLSKKIIENRLKSLGAQEYNIRLDEQTGSMFLELPEQESTDEIISQVLPISKFKVIDDTSKEELMNNNDIENVQVQYGSSSQSATDGTSVYLTIQFNKEGAKKLEDISKEYREGTESSEETTEDESTKEATEGNTTEENSAEENATGDSTDGKTETEESTKSKNVTLMIDDEKIMTTNFDRDIVNGVLSLTYGKATTDQEELQKNITKANNLATLLKNEVLPIKYVTDENKYIQSDITESYMQYFVIGVSIVIGLALIILVLKYKTNGLLAAIAYIGFSALLLLIIRYSNTVLSLEGIFAILIVFILNYIITNKILKKLKEAPDGNKAIKETYKDFFIKLIPVIIMSLTFCFVKLVTFISFGNVMFWGVTLIILYNFFITGTLLKLKIGGTNNE